MNLLYHNDIIQSFIHQSILNTRENHGWEVSKSLLMDGSHHRPEINLQKVTRTRLKLKSSTLSQVIFNQDNILSLFEKFNVPKKFDLLSEDSDAYDFFLTEAILEARKRLMDEWLIILYFES